ncbi:hypothetical protein U1Q18_046666 [Sarracenia purpurea var. burkii]
MRNRMVEEGSCSKMENRAIWGLEEEVHYYQNTMVEENTRLAVDSTRRKAGSTMNLELVEETLAVVGKVAVGNSKWWWWWWWVVGDKDMGIPKVYHPAGSSPENSMQVPLIQEL